MVVLEPIYTSLLRTSLSSSSHPGTTLSLPLFPFLSPLPTSPHFLSHFHCLVTVRPLARPPFVCSAYGGAEKRTVTSSCPFGSPRFTESWLGIGSPIGKIDFLLLPRNVKEEKAYVEIINDKFEDRNNFSIHTSPPESLLPKISVR